MSIKNAGQVTREAKRQLRLAGLPAYNVTTTFTKLNKPSPRGDMFGWQTFIHGLDAESIEIAELVMGNMPGPISLNRSTEAGFLSVVTEDQ